MMGQKALIVIVDSYSNLCEEKPLLGEVRQCWAVESFSHAQGNDLKYLADWKLFDLKQVSQDVCKTE